MKAVEKSRKIQLGWKHFKDHTQGFVLVPLAKGGGTRTISMPTTSSRINLIQRGKHCSSQKVKAYLDGHSLSAISKRLALLLRQGTWKLHLILGTS